MENNVQKFYSGGFFYNPKTQAVLLHLRDGNTLENPNKWALFGGSNEGSESPKECFIREIKEELGVFLKENEVKYLCDYLNVDRGTQHYVFYVESDIAKDKMELNEGADFDWIPLANVFEYDLHDKTKNDLKTFLKIICL
jgi:8-oxo-dGTP diphosphatase